MSGDTVCARQADLGVQFLCLWITSDIASGSPLGIFAIEELLRSYRSVHVVIDALEGWFFGDEEERGRQSLGWAHPELHDQWYHHHQGEEGSLIYKCLYTSFKFLQAWRCARSWRSTITSSWPALPLLSLRGSSRAARSEKGASCWPKGSVKTQEGGAWGRQRKRGGTTFIFGAEVLQVKVSHLYMYSVVFVIIFSAWQGVGWPESTRHENKPNSEIKPLIAVQRN